MPLLLVWKKMEKLAYKTTGPLQETTRHNIRGQVDESGEEVFFLRKRPLSFSELSSSPKQGDKTFLLVEDGKMKVDFILEQQIKDLKEELETFKKELESLKRQEEVRNSELYEPLCGHRVQAAISLMKPVRDKLDAFVEEAITKQAKRAKGQAERDEFHNKFGNKTYLQLMGFSDPVVETIVKSAEHSLLATYVQQGIEVSHNIDVKRAMKAFKKIKRKRDQAGHVFDYDFEDASRASAEERKDYLTIQAKILKDIKKGIEMNWLSELVDSKEDSLLLLEVESKTLELQKESCSTIDESASMSYRAAVHNQKCRKVQAEEERLQAV